MKNTILHLCVLFSFCLFLSQTSHAYLSVSETSELLQKDDYRIGLMPQFLIANGGGTNVAAFFDMSVDPAVNTRFLMGGGDTDFFASASAKWVPFPDVERQPAIGFRGALIYARDTSIDFYDIQFTPIISKIIHSDIGKLNPYIGLPVTFIMSSKTNTTATQFAVGTEWVDNPQYQIGGELDLNLSNTTSAITFHLNFPFNGKEGYRR